jgi:hypothetical protein
MPSTPFAQVAHRRYTIHTSCPHDVDVAACRPAPTVRCVSQTPTYDQLRGERINAEIPASKDRSLPVDPPGKHQPLDSAAGALAHGQSPEAAAHLTPAWSWFESVHAGPAGKHHLWEEASDSVDVHDQSATPPAHQSRVAPSPPGPQAAIPPVAHARHMPPHGSKNCLAPEAVDKPEPGTAACGRAAHETQYLMPKAVH